MLFLQVCYFSTCECAILAHISVLFYKPVCYIAIMNSNNFKCIHNTHTHVRKKLNCYTFHPVQFRSGGFVTEFSSG